jgi:hypothetical protein
MSLTGEAPAAAQAEEAATEAGKCVLDFGHVFGSLRGTTSKTQKGTEIYSADVFVILHLQLPRHVHSAPVIS